ncbi:porin family protein [Hymenobacter sp. YC55]|uniref:porin family protein n=1 Tax=Hymenobacter sp. YC55 TaxID=3034019 RepID=UPI0023F75BE0|nr:porin family protein [Hymenobacter sp. YC55]MDF7814402.1 porin family protein [Hymenobacter sp. YC55]
MSRIIIILCILLLAGTAQAQFGLRAGVNSFTLSIQSEEDQQASASRKTGYHAGIFYELKLTNKVSLLPEVQYSRQSTNLQVVNYRVADGGYQGDYRLQLTYLAVPILVKANLGKFFLEAGPQASYLLAAHEEGTESLGYIWGTTQNDVDRSATNRYRRFDVGLCAGAGVKLPAGFRLGIRAYSGLVSLTHGPIAYYNYGGSLKNQVMQASVSYLFKTGS